MKSQIDVNYVAQLAQLKLSDEQATTFQGQLESILGFIDKLKELPFDDSLSAQSQGQRLSESLRQDVIGESLTAEAVVANAPESQDLLIKVPKVVADA